MILTRIQTYISEAEQNNAIREEKNFDARRDVIDFIEWDILNRIEDLLRKTNDSNTLNSLRLRTEKLKSELEKIDARLFQKLRTNIRNPAAGGTKFIHLLEEFFDIHSNEKKVFEEPAYDNLDVFINQIYSPLDIPKPTRELEPEMVYYQKTPARIILQLVSELTFHNDDVFFDLGSGLGQVVILVHLLTGIRAIGVEFEPAFSGFAAGCARDLQLSHVEFIHADAREADYSEGTVFFMFTPFSGSILQEVLELLRKESLKRKIKIITYGPCTTQVALADWLDSGPIRDLSIYKPVVFTSL